jgi:hypothetical protein
VPTVEAFTSDGTRLSLDFRSNTGTVIYYLSPTCGWCERNYANIVALGKAASARYRFVGVVRDRDRTAIVKHLAESPLPFQVFVVEDPRWFETTTLVATPATVFVDPEGTIRQLARRVHITARKAEIERFFAVTLPGIEVEAQDQRQ